jgi:hypothetical protein
LFDEGSFELLKELYVDKFRFLTREDLTFGYLIGSNTSPDSEEVASDFAYNNGLLFNTISENNVELVLKTLRTRTARLVTEIGSGLANIL